jgi:hypothetical protein
MRWNVPTSTAFVCSVSVLGNQCKYRLWGNWERNLLFVGQKQSHGELNEVYLAWMWITVSPEVG